MTVQNQNEVLINIQQLIDKSRCSIDGFFTDSRKAAADILTYLEAQEIIVKTQQSVGINYNETSKAA